MDLKELAQHRDSLRHPWELARADFFTNALSHLPADPGPKRALDVGSGDTWLANRLLENMPAHSSMVCVDSSYSPELIASLQKPAIRLTTSLPKGEIFDLVFLLDVVEHVEDPKSFLNEVKALLKPGGLLVISVPAYQGLFTAHDTWLGHFRRYSPQEGRQLVKESGFQLLEDGSFFHSLLYARALSKLREKIAGQSEQKGVGGWSKGPTITGAIHKTLNLDWRVSEGLRRIGVRLPGLSWWCVCRKP